MPCYEFRCPDCGGFELELTMKQASSRARCPSCGEAAPRVYGSIGLMTLGQPLRDRMAGSVQPRVMKKEQMQGVPLRSHSHPHVSRPWQAGH